MEDKSNRRASQPQASSLFHSTTFTLDVVANVLGLTIFSPYLAVIPAACLLRGSQVTDPTVLKWAVYCLGVLSFRIVRRYSWLWRNQGSLFLRPKRIDWSKQVAVVTGGASGLGRALAVALAARNVRVAVLDVNPGPDAPNDGKDHAGPPIAHYICDVSNWQEVESVAKNIRVQVGTPTIVINNAGVVQAKLLLDLTHQDINQTFGVNTLAHFWTLKAFLPAMVEKKEGHIVTISSIMGILGIAQLTDYCASKASLIAMDQALRYELDHRYNCPNIRTTLVCPGWITTPMFQAIKFPTNPLFKFGYPPVQTDALAGAILGALEDQHSRRIFLPLFAYFTPYFNLLPSFARDFLQWFTGADYCMQGLKDGRNTKEKDVSSDA